MKNLEVGMQGFLDKTREREVSYTHNRGAKGSKIA